MAATLIADAAEAVGTVTPEAATPTASETAAATVRTADTLARAGRRIAMPRSPIEKPSRTLCRRRQCALVGDLDRSRSTWRQIRPNPAVYGRALRAMGAWALCVSGQIGRASCRER